MKDSVACLRLAETLLYLASDQGRKPIPFNWFLLTAGIAAALYEHLTGRTDFPAKFRNPEFESFTPVGYEQSFNEWLDELLKEHGTKLNPSLRRTFKDLLTIEWVPKDGPSDGYNTNGMHYWKQNMIQLGHFSNIYGDFNFTVREAESVREYIERELSEEARCHCEEMAQCIGKDIDRDLDSR